MLQKTKTQIQTLRALRLRGTGLNVLRLKTGTDLLTFGQTANPPLQFRWLKLWIQFLGPFCASGNVYIICDTLLPEECRDTWNIQSLYFVLIYMTNFAEIVFANIFPCLCIFCTFKNGGGAKIASTKFIDIWFRIEQATFQPPAKPICI